DRGPPLPPRRRDPLRALGRRAPGELRRLLLRPEGQGDGPRRRLADASLRGRSAAGQPSTLSLAPVARIPSLRRERPGRHLLVGALGGALRPASLPARAPPPESRSVRIVERGVRAPHDAVLPEVRAPRDVRRLPDAALPLGDPRLHARRPGRPEELPPTRPGHRSRDP